MIDVKSFCSLEFEGPSGGAEYVYDLSDSWSNYLADKLESDHVPTQKEVECLVRNVAQSVLVSSLTYPISITDGLLTEYMKKGRIDRDAVYSILNSLKLEGCSTSSDVVSFIMDLSNRRIA